MRARALILLMLIAPSCQAQAVGELAERYVRLALEFGEKDPDYIDAYLGPSEWRDQAGDAARPMVKLSSDISALLAQLRSFQSHDASSQARVERLFKRTRAMHTRMRMLRGEKFSFADEAFLLYDVEIPAYTFDAFDDLLGRIDALVPGKGGLSERLSKFRADFAIPTDRIPKVFELALHECRQRTIRHIHLPAEEHVRLEYVTNKSWYAYNWYKGNFLSEIQVNIDLPMNAGNAINLACHEGYPGHHVANVLIEQRQINGKGWIEYSLFPLFGPEALISEGSANYGVDHALPKQERTEYLKSVLLPAAGLDPGMAEVLTELGTLKRQLNLSLIPIAQRFHDGEIDHQQAVELQRHYGLVSSQEAEQFISAVTAYGSYVLNAVFGEKLVKDYVERSGVDAASQWAAFERLVVDMPSPSRLMESITD